MDEERHRRSRRAGGPARGGEEGLGRGQALRDLTQPRVIEGAAAAAAFTAFVSYSRMALWLGRPGQVWVMEAAVFTTAFFLWAFVFAWHGRYTGRPAFVAPRLAPWAAVTVAAVFGAALASAFLDPVLRPLTPEVYPGSAREWAAMALFDAGFVQLFLCFAPMAYFARVSSNPFLAGAATVGFGLLVAALRLKGLPAPVPFLTAAAVLAVRGVSAACCVWAYREGGVLLTLWWTLLLDLRLLAALAT
ncbi:MAG: hypothetical protein HY928_07870 [Elusimicrobia bacterium]|nr:hypothetical protein [Elusimicrobiota bacterium]